MKDFFKILKYAKSYYIYAILNIVFNILTVFFSLVSLTMAIPFLGLLFGTIEVENIQPESFSLTPESIKDHFYFERRHHRFFAASHCCYHLANKLQQRTLV